ncbi:hypothetical protein [Hufsiella ginkgonis]|uniref:Uncharacterized protein n=1 Tax=Hufsiella ginkgonis TaxID=2695274 RepID=A0A7K1XSM7_9SPHI|nr:hypothetical protein [Hufsiella ginkgonis]MXV14005.1 hypothetical protein [Hufsiella ginkgonis]
MWAENNLATWGLGNGIRRAGEKEATILNKYAKRIGKKEEKFCTTNEPMKIPLIEQAILLFRKRRFKV